MLATWPVRRLGMIAHGGAASLITTQTTSRLEHSLGVMTLAAHFAPEDTAGRAAALLHDLGHGPFSHTLEGIGGVDHHRLGQAQLSQLTPVIIDHGIDPAEVANAMAGMAWTVLENTDSVLGLDHLDGLVRSSHAHGRLRRPAWQLLGDLRLVRGQIHTDATTGTELADLALAEASYHTWQPNLVAVGMLRRATLALASEWPEWRPADLTDHELLAAILAHPTVGPPVRAWLADPSRVGLRRVSPGEPADVRFWQYYLDGPMVDGAPLLPTREQRAALPATGAFALTDSD